MTLIKIDKKFTESSLDRFAHRVFRGLDAVKNPEFLFDFSETEWISNEELVVFTSIIKYLKARKIPFKFQFIAPGLDVTQMPERVANQLLQLWDIWKIYQILGTDMADHLGFGTKGIEKLKEKYGYYSPQSEIFNRYGITPFVTLEKVSNYEDKAIKNTLTSVYKLNQATKEILKKYNAEHPFINNVLSHIVTKELYENFLDHFQPGVFSPGIEQSFMSLCLRTQLNETKHSPEKIQQVLKSNFDTEAIPEMEGFFYDNEKKEFRNRNVIQFSFLDLGKGIISTLTPAYLEDTKNKTLFSDGASDSKILAYAFHHSSSRHGIFDRNKQRNTLIPRGLFDVLSMVKMYRGMLTARSAYGKVLYDFSDGKSFDKALKIFPQLSHYFPGTLISIYFPADITPQKHEATSIKPRIDFERNRTLESKYINLYQIISTVKKKKKDKYEDLIATLREHLPDDRKSYTVFFSFRGNQNDTRLTKKTLFFLMSDYDINLRCNIIIVHPPPEEFIEEVNREIADLAHVERTFKIHPLPLIYTLNNRENLKVKWMGVFDESDEEKLNDLLSEEFSLAISDFREPGNVIGHVNFFDEHGNLKTHLPNWQTLLDYYRTGYKKLDEEEVQRLLVKNVCFSPENAKLYLCHGNYYQKEFVEIIHLLNNEQDCDLACEVLFMWLSESELDINNTKFIGVTSSSHKILTSFLRQDLIKNEQIILLDNYYTFDKDQNFSKIKEGFTYVLVCDVISTGFLADRLAKKLAEKYVGLEKILVLVNSIDSKFEQSVEFEQQFGKDVISIIKRPVEKFRRDSDFVKNYLKDNAPVRINPFTNVAITLSSADTISNSILLESQAFLDIISDDAIIMAYLHFNSVIHPYFFDTKKIIQNIELDTLQKIFDKVIPSPNNVNVFYPRESGVQFMDFPKMSTQVFRTNAISYYELERFRTLEGWRFPHATDYFLKLNKGKTILLLDDGSCTGDSILQMIDEIAFSEVKEIILLCIVGRVSDHKREFFSRINSIKGPHNKTIPVSIYFVCHWHIPTYYFDENPNTKERMWLERVKSLSNTPERLKSIASTILLTITPRELEEVKDYKYVPKIRNNNKEEIKIPKKEILRVREEVGKVIGYRFYKQSFSYFDQIIKLYEGVEKTDRNKEMELLCSTFLYEPYLYSKLSIVLPDIVDKIEEFVDALIFGNPKRNSRTIDIATELHYDWDKRDVVHLFFIVYNGTKLFQKLSDTKNVEKLFKYVDEGDKSISYVLFKLLAYFPLHSEDQIESQTGILLHQIDYLLQRNVLSRTASPILKTFRSFVSTLPSQSDYLSQLGNIYQYYRINKDSAEHKYSVLAHLDKMFVDLAVMKKGVYNFNAVTAFTDSWTIVRSFIESLLTFSSTFPSFFLSEINSLEGNNEYSLRYMHGQLNQVINNLDSSSEFETIRKLLTRFKEKFLNPVSVIPKIFNEVITTNAIIVTSKFITDEIEDSEPLRKKGIRIDFSGNTTDGIDLDLPPYHLCEIILKEIILNFKHSGDGNIEIKYAMDEEFLFITITNDRGTISNQGSGHGISMLEKLKAFPNKTLKYSNNQKDSSGQFTQLLQIKKA